MLLHYLHEVKMELSLQQLKQLLPKNPYVEHWHQALSQLLPDYEINTPQRIAAYVAQCSHESAGFTALKGSLWPLLRSDLV